MKKILALAAGGIILAGGLVVLYMAAEGRFWNNPSPEASLPSAPAPSAPPASSGAPSATGPESDAQPAAGSVAADTGAPATNASENQPPVNPMAQLIPDQFLPAKLQDALRQYPSLSDRDDRASLVMDVLGMTDNGATKQQVTQVLGTMFHQEPTADLKLDLLDDLIMVGDDGAIPAFVEAIDPNQPKEVRTKGILALENVGDSQAVPYIQELLADPDPDIRQTAQEAMDRLNPQ